MTEAELVCLLDVAHRRPLEDTRADGAAWGRGGLPHGGAAAAGRRYSVRFADTADSEGGRGAGRGIGVSATADNERDSLTAIASESPEYPQGDSKHPRIPQQILRIPSQAAQNPAHRPPNPRPSIPPLPRSSPPGPRCRTRSGPASWRWSGQPSTSRILQHTRPCQLDSLQKRGPRPSAYAGSASTHTPRPALLARHALTAARRWIGEPPQTIGEKPQRWRRRKCRRLI
jgi:hypothetical protein